MYTVYAHINNINGKIYIGITSFDMEKRWANGYGYHRNETFHNDIQKYGWDGFFHEIVASNLTEDEALNFEKILIEKTMSYIPKNGYNKSLGGGRCIEHSQTTKSKISKIKKEKYSRDKAPKRTPVICEGVLFNTIADCAEHYNINHSKMRHWVSGAEPTPIEFIEMGFKRADGKNLIYVKKDLKNMNGTKVIYMDKQYESISEFAEEIGVSRAGVSSWFLGLSSMPEEYYKNGLRLLDGDNSNIKMAKRKLRSKVICDGNIFESIKECASYYNVNHGTMADWIRGHRTMPKKFKDLGLKKI